MTAYYNENDPGAAAWLRELIKAGVIAPGDVDERSIEDVRPDDLAGYAQCHFFAGIGGWSYALRLAGWPDDKPVWTGSCPCQPFSSAGKGGGFADERHLWPAWHHLIRECGPAVVFGEQVAKKAGDEWFDLVSSDLEAEGYAVGSAVLGAHSVGAPHIRQRRYFVADSYGFGRGSGRTGEAHGDRPLELARRGDVVVVADRRRPRLEIVSIEQAWGQRSTAERSSEAGALANCGGIGCERWPEASGLAETSSAKRSQSLRDARPCGGLGTLADDDDGRRKEARSQLHDEEHHAESRSRSFWAGCEWLPCRDGKARPAEPGTFPLAHGVPGCVGLLRGYGNAIVPQVAAEFIAAFCDLS